MFLEEIGQNSSGKANSEMKFGIFELIVYSLMTNIKLKVYMA